MDRVFKALTVGIKFDRRHGEADAERKAPKKRPRKTERDQDVGVFRKRKEIKVYGADVPPPIRRFSSLMALGVDEWVVKRVRKRGFKRPTPVQMQAIPLLVEGRDSLVIGPTGSGKTLAFLVPLVHFAQKTHGDRQIKGLVIAPTKELAEQIYQEAKALVGPKERGSARVGLLNKTLVRTWEASRSRDPAAVLSYPDILVASPLRLVNCLKTGIVSLGQVKTVVLDEADKLLDLCFLEQLDEILVAFGARPVQKALFSATIPTGIETVARTFMAADPVRIVVGRQNAATATIKQELVYVGKEEGKIMAIRQMLVAGIEPPVIVFAETIERARTLFNELVHLGVNVDIIHSERTLAERENTIRQFRAGRLWFLITTELLARGLDFPEVASVINYDFPATTASYIHRIGRTGRAGKKGKAVTLFTLADAERLKVVVNVMRQSGCEVPEWMLHVKKLPNKYAAKKVVK